MNVKEGKSKGLNKSYTVTIAAADFAAAVDKKLNSVAKNIKLPGFRAGKAPKAMIEQKYRPSVLGEVLDDMIRDASNKVIDDNKLRPAVTPDIKIEKFEDGKDIEFTIETEVLPEITLGDFSKISLKKYTAKVPAEEIEKAIKYMADSRRDTVKIEKDRAAKKGDVVVIDFVGSIDGKEFEGGKWYTHKCSYFEMPALAKQNSIIIYGKFEKDVEYDYLDNCEIVIYSPVNGKIAKAEIYDTESKKIFEITSERIGDQVKIRHTKTDRTFTVKISSIDKIFTVNDPQNEEIIIDL